MNVEIAQRLAARRKQAGLSQEALAEQLGVSRQAVSKWERSESSPDTDNLIALAQLYKLSLDELLYVEDAMRDDVVFEAEDRAAERASASGSVTSEPEAPSQPSAESEEPSPEATSSEAWSAAPAGEKSKSKVRIGFGGIHVLDGDDYVHVSWRDGVHVKDSASGDEVHVGWDGIHVTDMTGAKARKGAWRGAQGTTNANERTQSDDPGAAQASVAHEAADNVQGDAATQGRDWRAATEAWCNTDDPRERERQAARAWYGQGEPVQSAGQRADEGSSDARGTVPCAAPNATSSVAPSATQNVVSDTVPNAAASAVPNAASNTAPNAASRSVGDADDEMRGVIIGGEGVVVNGEHFDDWCDVRDRYGYGHIHEDRWYEPCGYTVNGERFDTMDDARVKYGPEVGKTIPVRKHYLREFEKSWVKFPYPLVVIIVYLLLGILNGAWGVGLFLFLTIPVYYMVGHAVGRRRIVPLISGVYPIAVIAWFCYMAFMMNQPHPAWVAFLTIPLVEWLVHSLSRWWRSRKRVKADAKAAPIDVDAQ